MLSTRFRHKLKTFRALRRWKTLADSWVLRLEYDDEPVRRSPALQGYGPREGVSVFPLGTLPGIMRDNVGLILAIAIAAAATTAALYLGFTQVTTGDDRACGSVFGSKFSASQASGCERARSTRITWVLAAAISPAILGAAVYVTRAARSKPPDLSAPLWRRPTPWLAVPALVLFVVAVVQAP